MAESKHINAHPQPGQIDLFPDLQPEPPGLPSWLQDRRVSPVGFLLTVPNLQQAPTEWPHASWLRTDCLECGQFSSWVFTAEDGNSWEKDHVQSTGHRRFSSFMLSRVQFEVAAPDSDAESFPVGR
ncbi:hypothetical protein E1161_13450 [Saccharopolyspora aridisoli]|uniref:Uncharacterized protein n=1 Tax=Saccharopolyspora aridisoli TaxID=2530385 RepID=A0A4R4USM1_9PSEU|nr:hypothetical protein [Saccharopolyspora aridisoli]TDC92372.1 hypothetical protein E1161_13450 [Saccharopolyspora aridisoli]